MMAPHFRVQIQMTWMQMRDHNCDTLGGPPKIVTIGDIGHDIKLLKFLLYSYFTTITG